MFRRGKRPGADIPQHSLPRRCGAARAGLISLITSRKAPRPPLPSDLPAPIGFQRQLSAAPRAPQCWGGAPNSPHTRVGCSPHHPSAPPRAALGPNCSRSDRLQHKARRSRAASLWLFSSRSHSFFFRSHMCYKREKCEVFRWERSGPGGGGMRSENTCPGFYCLPIVKKTNAAQVLSNAIK